MTLSTTFWRHVEAVEHWRLVRIQASARAALHRLGLNPYGIGGQP